MYYIISNDNLMMSESIEILETYQVSVHILPEDYEDGKYIVEGEELVLNPNWEKEQEEKEKERIGNLQITKRVFALALQQFGITYTQLKELIATSEQAQLEWDLCVELQRKNPLLDVMAAQMGISSQMLDYIFQKANGEDVEPPTTEENSVVEEEDDNTDMVE